MCSWLQRLVVKSMSVVFVYPAWVSGCECGEHWAFALTSPSFCVAQRLKRAPPVCDWSFIVLL